MASYPPPTETLPIFNVNEFRGTTTTSSGGGGAYVDFPTAQGYLNLVGFGSSGTATLTNLVVNGTTDLNNNVNLAGDLVLDGVNASINFLNGTIQDSAYTGLTSSAGTYPDANLTIDVNGKITAISAGTGSSILTTNNTFTGTNTFTNTVDISGTTLNIADNSILECNEATVNIGDGGNGQLNIECPINVGGFGDITLLNSDILMIDDAVITQSGTRTIPNTLYTTDILNGSYIKYNSDNTQQTSAFTGAGALSGSYTNTNMTVDANGRITALASGAVAGDAKDEYIAYPLSQSSEIYDYYADEWLWNRPIAPTFNPPYQNNMVCLQASANGQWTIQCSTSQGILISPTYATGALVDGTDFWRQVAVVGAVGCGISANANYMWYMTSTQVFTSTNQGVSWGAGVSLPSSVAGSTSGVIVSSANGQYVYALQQTAIATVAVWKSSNFGATWTQVSIGAQEAIFGSGLIFAQGRIAVSASGKYVIFAYVKSTPSIVGGLAISSDFGASFSFTTSLGSGANMDYGSLCCMNMIGDRMYYMIASSGTQNQLYTSTDFGQTWTLLGLTLAGTYQISSGFSCSGSGQYLMINNRGALGNQISTNYGVNLSQITIGATASGRTNPYIPYQNGCISQDGRYFMGIWIANLASINAQNIPCFYQQQIYEVAKIDQLVATARPYYYANYQNFPSGGGAFNQPTTINTIFTSASSYPPNVSVQFRVSVSIVYTATGSATTFGSCYTYDAVVDVYPYRLGNISSSLNASNLITNAINGNTNFYYVDATYAPRGRQFWAHNIVSTGSLDVNGKIQAFCSNATGTGLFAVLVNAPVSSSTCNININVEMISQYNPFGIQIQNILPSGGFPTTSAYGGYSGITP